MRNKLLVSAYFYLSVTPEWMEFNWGLNFRLTVIFLQLFVFMHAFRWMRGRLSMDSSFLWAVARQAPQSIGFSRQEYWSRLPFPSPGDLPDPGIEPVSLGSPALADGVFTIVPPGKPLTNNINT